MSQPVLHVLVCMNNLLIRRDNGFLPLPDKTPCHAEKPDAKAPRYCKRGGGAGTCPCSCGYNRATCYHATQQGRRPFVTMAPSLPPDEVPDPWSAFFRQLDPSVQRVVGRGRYRENQSLCTTTVSDHRRGISHLYDAQATSGLLRGEHLLLGFIFLHADGVAQTEPTSLPLCVSPFPTSPNHHDFRKMWARNQILATPK